MRVSVPIILSLPLVVFPLDVHGSIEWPHHQGCVCVCAWLITTPVHCKCHLCHSAVCPIQFEYEAMGKDRVCAQLGGGHVISLRVTFTCHSVLSWLAVTVSCLFHLPSFLPFLSPQFPRFFVFIFYFDFTNFIDFYRSECPVRHTHTDTHTHAGRLSSIMCWLVSLFVPSLVFGPGLALTLWPID